MNSDLVNYLKERPVAALHPHSPTQTSLSYRRRLWRVRDRLSDRDTVRLVMAYTTGIAAGELAEHYHIGAKSVQKLLREIGIRERSGFDIQQ